MENNEMQRTCPIWDTQATACNDPERKGLTVDSPRAGGKYFISEQAMQKIGQLDDKKKARLTSWLINQRALGNECPKIDERRIDEKYYEEILTKEKRANLLLKLIALKASQTGEPVSLTKFDIPENDSLHQEMMAWSESTELKEVASLMMHLWKKGWVDNNLNFQTGTDTTANAPANLNKNPFYVKRIYITVEGDSHLEKLDKTSQNSSKAFVAMWFDKSMDKAWLEGIKPAITDSGYDPVRVDKDEDIGKIDDRIIAEIRRSRFIVADFTHGKAGARGGVYYEAGFAHGLNIHVFFTCRKNLIDSLHFDIRQYSTVLWETPEELREKLANRISAVIGDGPKKKP